MNRWSKREQHEKACAGVRAHRGLCCRFMAACLAFTLAAAPAAAWAASPEFAYDEETWARLKDNTLEYEEIPLLV